jgi:energy-converting hydrogenase Eha subunit A
MRISFKNWFYGMIQFTWLLICILLLLVINIEIEDNPYVIYTIVIISLVLGIYITTKLSGSFLNIAVLFLLITYIFHHGQHIIAFFGIPINYYRDYIMTEFSNSSIVSASIFSIIMINVLQLGMAFTLTKPSNEGAYGDQNDAIDTAKVDARIRTWGMILFVVCILPTLYYDFLRIGQSFISSYAQSYTYGSNTITTYASQLFEIAIFALIYVNRNNAKWKYFYYPKVCWELIKLVLIGNRMGPISSLLAIYLLKTGLITPERPRKNKFRYIIIAFVGIFLMGFVSAFRNTKGSFSIFQAIIESLTTRNAIVSFFTESGTTLLDQVLLIDLVPESIPFVHGKTYINSLSILIPFSTRIFGQSSTDYISIGSILNGFWYNRGLGGSVIAEAYFNFGWFSFIFFAVLGFVISKYQYIYSKVLSNENRPLLLIALTFLTEQLLIYPRGYFYAVISSVNIIVYSLILYWLLREARKKT